MRRPSWSKYGRRETVRLAADDAPAILERLARTIDARAPRITRGRMEIAYSLARRDRYKGACGRDRAWRGVSDGRELWCVLDAQSQRELLALVLGGPGSDKRTSAERAIIAETINRLFEFELREEAHERPGGDAWWRCNIDISAAERCATLQLLLAASQAPLPPPAPCDVDLARIPLRIAAALAPVPCAIADVRRWQPGTSFPIAGSTGALVAQIRSGRILLAAAQLGASAGRRALRVVAVQVEAHVQG